MIRSLLTILCLTPFMIFCQDSLRIGFSFSPDICYKYSVSAHSASYNDSVDFYSSRNGFSTGFILNKPISRNTEIEYGVSYSLQSINKTTSEYSYVAAYATNRMRSNYVTVPVRLNYLIGTGQLRFVASIGLTPGIEITSKSAITFYDSNEQIIDRKSGIGSDYPQFILNIEPRLGLSYSTKNLDLRIMPVFRYSVIGSHNIDAVFYPLSGGISGTILYKLKLASKKKTPPVQDDEELN